MSPTVSAVIASLLLAVNTLFWGIILFTFTFLKVVIPHKGTRKVITWILNTIANIWITGNSGWMKLTQKMNWNIQRPDNLSRKGWYFVVSNHQSWVDILVLQHTLNGRIPLLKFFLKQNLIWVPVMGAAWWALDFPFMKRYTKEYLKKHPEMKGKDIETTRKACEKFRDLPTSVMNFVEGTRFTQKKHDSQQSPHKHLLKPRAGGMAFALSSMGDQFNSILDVTIDYPDGVPTFWEFMQGKMDRVTVVVEEKPIPAELLNGDYENDEAYRLNFQLWLTSLWEEKDKKLEALRS